ncbi:uncharacterized protein LOC116299433 [Actinia tenebrosa]|uniref:Uncharacterized protein LOC116299433 n=1 Tax=Actinia tenebrosa TaxID=6105 RepID=A0A6P8I7I5_ACTTE|nr:uncharacterized protein LOC116299433 [Actinia tenebrosa]
MLSAAKTWYIDSTFKVVHWPFTQLFTINTFVKSNNNAKQLSLVFVVLLEKKKKRRQKKYIIILNIQQLGLQPLYQQNEDVYKYVRKMMALPFLHHH